MDLKYILLFAFLGLIMAIVAGAAGYFYSSNQASISQKTTGKTLVETSPVFQNQTATVLGKISKTEGDKATIVSQDNKEETFPVAKKFVLYKPVRNNQATPSSDLKQIDPNMDAFINLEVIDGKYQIVSITYLPPIPPAPMVPAPKQ